MRAPVRDRRRAGQLLAGLVAAAPAASAQESTTSTTVPLDRAQRRDLAGHRRLDRHALADAADEDAPLAIIRLDTPGGLDTSMRDIVKDILAAPMPVVVYVYAERRPRRRRPGVYITQAADVAAMAPETNIGSASPITSGGDIGDTLGRKITNDAAAYVRALAAATAVTPTWPSEMVREATNVTAAEALDAGLIDLIAPDQEALLADLDGFQVKGPKADDARHRRLLDLRAPTCRSATSCCSSSSTRTSPTCCS